VEIEMITPAPFSDAYLKFTQVYNQMEVREEDHTIRVPEKVIRCIWNDQLFCTPSLKTQDGQDLEIVYPGYWNFGKGPDFTSATIKVNGKTYDGDVELHVYSTDWNAHGHSGNPDFDNVILHVYMWQGRGKESRAKVQQKELPFQFEIKDYLTKGILDLNDELDFETYPVLNHCNVGLCHQPLAKLSEEKLTQLLNAAGEARVFTKMERFHDSIIIEGYEQTFYRGVAEAMGYPENKQAFQTLADTLPLSELTGLVPKKIRKTERALHYQAILFGLSGLMTHDTEKKPGFQKLLPIWKIYQDQVPPTPLTKKDWSFRAIRPANYPYRRIAALAHLMVRHEKAGIFADFMGSYQKILAACGDEIPDNKTLNTFNDFFCVSADDYWASHYTPDGKTLPQTQQLVGSARSREIIINIGLPIGLIFARAGKFKELEIGLNALFQTGKRASDHKLLRFMKHYIFGNQEEMLRVLHSEKQIQGLMQVYQDFCTQNQNNCLHCPFPDVVNRYFS
jgi:hypothetical protein